MRIVVDAFGSETAPATDVAGAVMAAREWGDEIILVGPEARIKEELSKHATESLYIRVVDAPEIISMSDHAKEVRDKVNSSIRVGMKMVGSGDADAFVSVGNTIAVLSAAIFDLRRIRGIRRPALASIYPLSFSKLLLLDIGATADPKPEYLLQFARMGGIYAEKVLGVSNPRIGLLANGEEEEKGSMALRETFRAFKSSDLNFVGNIEPTDATKGMTDVLVTDGFTGNIMVKTAESVASFASRMLKRDVFDGVLPKLALLLLLPAAIVALPSLLLLYPGIKRLIRRMDYAELGGAVLLGVDGVAIVGHGRSNAKAVKNAIRQAREAVAGQVVQTIKAGLAGSA